MNSKDTQGDEIIWIEGNGVGYCLTEEDYNEREKEVKQHLEKEMNE